MEITLSLDLLLGDMMQSNELCSAKGPTATYPCRCCTINKNFLYSRESGEKRRKQDTIEKYSELEELITNASREKWSTENGLSLRKVSNWI